jgi:hypothetical protein
MPPDFTKEVMANQPGKLAACCSKTGECFAFAKTRQELAVVVQEEHAGRSYSTAYVPWSKQ